MVDGPEANERNRLGNRSKILHRPRTTAVEPRQEIRRRRCGPIAGGGNRKRNCRLRVREVPVRRSPRQRLHLQTVQARAGLGQILRWQIDGAIQAAALGVWDVGGVIARREVYVIRPEQKGSLIVALLKKGAGPPTLVEIEMTMRIAAC